MKAKSSYLNGTNNCSQRETIEALRKKKKKKCIFSCLQNICYIGASKYVIGTHAEYIDIFYFLDVCPLDACDNQKHLFVSG